MQQLKQSPGSNVGRYFFLLFGGLWTGISCCVAAGIIGPLAFSFDPNNLLGTVGEIAFPVIFMGIFILVGVIFLAVGILPLIARTRIDPPQVVISNSNLRSGEEFSLGYQQNFKSAVDIEKLVVQLLLRESATYRRGTDKIGRAHV